MKRIISSILIAGAAMSAAAATFTVSDGTGRTYADGDVVNVGYTYNGLGYDWEPGLKVAVNEETSLFGGSQFTVTASASEAGVVQFCGLTGMCTVLGTQPESHSNSYTAGSEFPLAIEILDLPAKLTSDITVSVKITDGAETVNLTVNFLTSEASIHEVGAGESSVSFAGRVMHYNVDTATKFSLYNISGRTMLDRTLSGSGSLSFTAIPAGVYVYRLGTKTGKILLK